MAQRNNVRIFAYGFPKNLKNLSFIFENKNGRVLKAPPLIPRDYIYRTSKVVRIEGRKICSKMF